MEYLSPCGLGLRSTQLKATVKLPLNMLSARAEDLDMFCSTRVENASCSSGLYRPCYSFKAATVDTH
jgi:hypothetical protein